MKKPRCVKKQKAQLEEAMANSKEMSSASPVRADVGLIVKLGRHSSITQLLTTRAVERSGKSD